MSVERPLTNAVLTASLNHRSGGSYFAVQKDKNNDPLFLNGEKYRVQTPGLAIRGTVRICGVNGD